MEVNFTLSSGPSLSLTRGKNTGVSFVVGKGLTATISPVATISVTTISDISITNVQDDDILQYNAETGYWENVQPTATEADGNNVTQTVKNVSGGELLKGTPVHAVTDANPSGQLAYVIAARADTPSAMPATFVLNETIANEAEGEALVVGLIQGVDTSAFAAGDVVYVGETGGYTNVKPTGDNLIQNLGVVLKSHQTSGSGMVYGSGRSNDVPNLPEGKFFIGSSTNTQESAYTLPTADGTSGQALTTDGSGTLSFSDIDVDLTIQNAINISNLDAAFSHMTTPITAGTSIEAVLRDMLEKYNITTITLSQIKAAFQGTDGNYGATSNVSSLGTREVGQGVKVDGFTFSIADTSQTADTSVLFKIGGSTVQSGISDTAGTVTLSSANTQDPGTATSVKYRVEATDNGSGTNNTIWAEKSVTWYYRVKVGASSTGTVTTNTQAQSLYDGLTTTGAYDDVKPNTTFTTNTSTAMNTSGNYTYIIYPASFTEITSIIQGGSIPVLGAFTDLGDFTIQNQYGVSVSYSIYRSNITQAFADNTTLEIAF